MKYDIYYQTYNRHTGEMNEYTDTFEGEGANCPNGIYFAVAAFLGNHLLELQQQRHGEEIDFWYIELNATDEDGFRYRLAQIDSVDLEL